MPPAANPRGVPRIGPVIAHEVEPRQPRRQPGHGVKRLQYALASDPVADTQERGPGVTPKVLPRPAGRRRHVPTRRDHQEVAGETRPAELLREQLAGHEHPLGAPVRRPVQDSLGVPPHRAVVDAARRLVCHHHHRRANSGHPRSEKRRGDAVEYHDLGTLCRERPQHARTMQKGEWEAPRGKRCEREPRAVPGSQLGKPTMIEIPAGQGVRVAQGH